MKKTDVAIVGAGFAGTCAAHAFSAEGFKVTLIDRRRVCPDVFRAEKIEADQAAIMRSLGLLERRSPRADTVGTILSYEAGVGTPVDTLEQYGISYAGTVNELRRTLPSRVDVSLARVTGIVPDARAPRVQAEDGTEVQARLVVLAAGGSDRLRTSLGIQPHKHAELRSLSLGFDIELEQPEALAYGGLNYVLPPNAHMIDYLTIFPIGPRMRVNLFTQMQPTDPLVREFKKAPSTAMDRYFPDLTQLTGPIHYCEPVQVVPTTFHYLPHAARPGVAIIGDEYQGVSPATGKGLSKLLTDVEALCTRHAPGWLAGGTVEERHVRAFYRDRAKVAADRDSLGSWIFYHNRQLHSVSITRRIRQRYLVRRLHARS